MAEESTWKSQLKDYAERLVDFAAHNPKEFIVSFFLLLAPLMMICGYLSYLMIQQIEDKEKKEKKKAIKSRNAVKARRKATKAD